MRTSRGNTNSGSARGRGHGGRRPHEADRLERDPQRGRRGGGLAYSHPIVRVRDGASEAPSTATATVTVSGVNFTRILDNVTVNNQGSWTVDAGVNNVVDLNNGTVFNNNNSFTANSISLFSSVGGGTFNNNFGFVSFFGHINGI